MQPMSKSSMHSTEMPAIVKNYLDGQTAEYSVISHSGTQTLEETATMIGMPSENMLRSVIFTNGMNMFMAVLPLSKALDFRVLKNHFGGQIRVATKDEIAVFTENFMDNVIPPISQIVTLPTIIDSDIRKLEKICFEAGCHHNAVVMDANAFVLMQKVPVYFDDIAFPITQVVAKGEAIPDSISVSSIRERIASIYELPAMPGSSSQLIMLRNKPDASVAELAAIIEMDPSLAAQTLKYARSPLFGYRGEINTLGDAIARVLGFDMVLNVAMGIAIGKAFKNPADGPLGLNAYWQHSVATAELARRLAQKMPTAKRPAPGTVYLSGLLHNFGFLLLGHLFQPEFYLLNKLAAANQGVPIVDLEKRLLGMGQAREAIDLGHAHIGAWLMDAWKMPEVVTISVREHHTVGYTGKHAAVVNLIQVANKLLARVGIGDEGEVPLPLNLLRSLELDAGAVEATFDKFVETGLPEVSLIAEVMTA